MVACASRCQRVSAKVNGVIVVEVSCRLPSHECIFTHANQTKASPRERPRLIVTDDSLTRLTTSRLFHVGNRVAPLKSKSFSNTLVVLIDCNDSYVEQFEIKSLNTEAHHRKRFVEMKFEQIFVFYYLFLKDSSYQV